MNLSSHNKPLEGIRVIELANYVAAPIVGRICADMGAEVIKIEGRGGDAWRATSMGHTKTGHDENPLFDIFNVGKKSISLNMKTEDGKELLFKLLEDADILITNTRNQSLVKLGLDYESLKDRYPRLIYATLTGYGYEGPDCNAPGFDNIAFWSRSGFSADMSFDAPGSYPVNSRYAMGDTIAGTTLFGGVMTALYQRERTGKGDFVTMSLYNAGIWAFGGSIVMAEKPYCHEFPEKRNFGVATNLPYRCADGEWIRCTFFEFERYAERFFGALGLAGVPEEMGIVTMADAIAAAEKLVPMLEKAFAAKTSEEWLRIFRELDVVCGRINHFRDVLEDEQAWANDYIQKYQCQNGAERILPTCPVRLGSQGAFALGKPVMYGENNDDILTSLNYTPEQIKALKENGTIG
ncbi:MAG: CoA transferase [Ruminococcaceae bacterium]|nr:CoA transferase [Oscillospiraceae bacterium]